MKFTTTAVLAAASLAGHAAADGPPFPWGGPPAFGGHPNGPPGGPTCATTSTVVVTSTTTQTVTTSVAGGAQAGPTHSGGWGAAPVTVTVTSTVSVGGSGSGGKGGGAGGSGSGSTTSAVGGSGSGGNGGGSGWSSSASAVGGSGSGGNGGGNGGGSGWSSSASAVGGSGSGSGGNGGGSGWSSSASAVGGNVGGFPGSGGNNDGPGGKGPWGVGGGSVISTLGSTGTNAYTITTSAVGTTTTHAAPTYSPGSGGNTTTGGSNLTEPGYNSPSNRQAWSPGFDINTDYTTSWPTTGKTVTYNWLIKNSTCNFDGTDRLCLAISENGEAGPFTVPGPTVEANWGDNVVITVTNGLTDNGTAIHWHGIRQLGTNPNDGVPGVTECALAPGQTRTYSWQATQYGSSWYHSHYLVQYGDGIRGPIVIHGPATANYDVDMGTVLVDDLFNLTASQMNSLISHNGALNAHNYLLNGKNTSPDLSTGQHAQWTVESGKKYLFRIVNSASQNSWWMHFDSHNITVIASDFVPIVPYTTDWLAIGTGQRYDVILTANQPVSNYFFRAVTQTACPSGTDNTGLGAANGIISYAGGNTTLLPTSTYGNVSLATFNTCQDEPLTSLVPWVAKSAGNSTLFTGSVDTLPAGNVTKVLTSDDGAVFRWFLNGNGFINVNWTQPTLESLAQNDTIAISNAIILPQTSVQWVYFVIQNVLPVGHPIHLHGHDFALLGQGLGAFTSAGVDSLNFVNPPRRDTAMLQGGPPTGGYSVIGFETDNPGAWLMHCHIAWHADGGLALQFVERQDKIPAVQWTQNTDFQNQCTQYEAFNAGGGGIKTSGESGLKKKWTEEESVVRRAGAEKRYLDNVAARGLGDGYKLRHVRR